MIPKEQFYEWNFIDSHHWAVTGIPHMREMICRPTKNILVEIGCDIKQL